MGGSTQLDPSLIVCYEINYVSMFGEASISLIKARYLRRDRLIAASWFIYFNFHDTTYFDKERNLTGKKEEENS